MGLLSGITINDVGSIFSGFGTLLKDVRTAITGRAPLDPTKLAELEAKTLEIEQIVMSAQSKINEIEAASPSVFVAGWRPFIGWICGLGIFYQFVGHPLFIWIIAIAHLQISPPILDTEGLLGLVLAMLGVGTLRSYEKIKGVARNN